MSTLEVTHGAIRRGRRVVLEAARISAAAPAAIAVVGVNGSGKTSLFMQLADVLRRRRSSSRVLLNGAVPSLAYVPQEPALPEWLRAEQLASAFGLQWGALLDAFPQLLLHELAGQRIAHLSVGQRQALAIGLALGCDAGLTLLDEPFSALDFRRRAGTHQLLRAHRSAGRSIMLSSQSASDLAGLCDHYVVLRDGRCVFSGPVSVLAATPTAEALEARLLELLA